MNWSMNVEGTKPIPTQSGTSLNFKRPDLIKVQTLTINLSFHHALVQPRTKANSQGTSAGSSGNPKTGILGNSKTAPRIITVIQKENHKCLSTPATCARISLTFLLSTSPCTSRRKMEKIKISQRKNQNQRNLPQNQSHEFKLGLLVHQFPSRTLQRQHD